jgi:hypothetical protein
MSRSPNVHGAVSWLSQNTGPGHPKHEEDVVTVRPSPIIDRYAVICEHCRSSSHYCSVIHLPPYLALRPPLQRLPGCPAQILMSRGEGRFVCYSVSPQKGSLNNAREMLTSVAELHISDMTGIILATDRLISAGPRLENCQSEALRLRDVVKLSSPSGLSRVVQHAQLSDHLLHHAVRGRNTASTSRCAAVDSTATCLRKSTMSWLGLPSPASCNAYRATHNTSTQTNSVIRSIDKVAIPTLVLALPFSLSLFTSFALLSTINARSRSSAARPRYTYI